MRKFYLLFAAMFAYSVVATAGIKNLFKQDFETVSTPADAGWTSPNLAGGMKIVSTEEGGWFEFNLGGNNNRNAVMNWNPAEGTIFSGVSSLIRRATVKLRTPSSLLRLQCSHRTTMFPLRQRLLLA